MPFSCAIPQFQIRSPSHWVHLFDRHSVHSKSKDDFKTKLAVVVYSYSPALGRCRREAEEFGVVFSYIVNLRAVWVARDCLKKQLDLWLSSRTLASSAWSYRWSLQYCQKSRGKHANELSLSTLPSAASVCTTDTVQGQRLMNEP